MLKICTNCGKGHITDYVENYYFLLYCQVCINELCKTCKRTLHSCIRCSKVHCEVCDFGFSHDSWYDNDEFKYLNCRDITIDELYDYIIYMATLYYNIYLLDLFFSLVSGRVFLTCL